MGFGFILAGFLFLANPVIHVIDIFPDCIGFWLIFTGLTKSAFFIDKLAEAKRGFWRLFLIDLVKAASIILWPYVSDTAFLLLSFVFSVLELMYFIPAMLNMIEGFSFAGVWYKGTAVYGKIPRRIFKYRNKMNDDGKYEKVLLPPKERGIIWRNFTIVFYCIRIFFTVLPEALAQVLYDRYVVRAMNVNYAEYKPAMYILLGFILCIIGIFWLAYTIRYVGSIMRDKTFIQSLKTKFTEDILPNTNLFTSIDMKRVLFLFAAAAVTSIMCNFDGVNVMIGAVSSVCIAAAAFILGKRMRPAYLAIPFSVIRAVLSVYNLLKQIEYYNDYSIESVDWVSTAYKLYYNLANMQVVEYILAIVPMLIVSICIIRAVRSHLDMIGVQTESVQYSQKARNAEIFTGIQLRFILNIVLMLINYVVCCIYPYAKVYIDVMSFITIAVTAVWVVQTLFLVYSVNIKVYDRLAGNY